MPRLHRFAFVLPLLAVACSDASDATTPAVVVPFAQQSHVPADGATVYLNDPITVSFSTQLDLDTVNPSTFAIEELDASGQPTLVAVPGAYHLANNGTMLWFQPTLPLDGAYQTGSFRAGHTYRVHVTDSLHDVAGQRLQTDLEFRFHTRTGHLPGHLFRDRDVAGPGRVGLTVPTDRTALPMEGVRLLFDQPLDPAPANYSSAAWLDYTSESGVVFLPGTVELESNTESGATLVLRPNWVLPPGHTVRVQVSAELRDLSGQNNTLTPNYSTLFGTFDT